MYSNPISIQVPVKKARYTAQVTVPFATTTLRIAATAYSTVLAVKMNKNVVIIRIFF